LAKGAENPAEEFKQIEGKLVLIKTKEKELVKGVCSKVFLVNGIIAVTLNCSWVFDVSFIDEIPLDIGKVGTQKLIWISPLWSCNEKIKTFWLKSKSDIQLIGEIPEKFLKYIYEAHENGNLDYIEFYHNDKYVKLAESEIVKITPDEIKTVYYGTENYSTSEICNIRLKKLKKL